MNSGLFPKGTLWKEKEKKKHNFIVEKHGKHSLSLVIMININNDKSCWFIYPWYDVTRTEPISPVLQPKTHNFCPIKRNTSDKSQLRDILQNIDTWAVLLKTVEVIKYKGSQRFYGQKEPKETWWLIAMWHPGWDSGIDKRH